MNYVVLVEPEGPANMGFVARVMKNFGFKNLVLVNPKCEINLETRKYAMHAWDIIENAKTLNSFDEIFELDVDLFVGTTAKTNLGTTRAAITPRTLAEKVRVGGTSVALLFGRESSGLKNSELRKCDIVLNIPTSEDYKAMNLSHAVAVVLYELFVSGLRDKTEADKNELRELVSIFEDLANTPGLGIRNPENASKMFRNVLSRSIVRGNELHGILTVLKAVRDKMRGCGE